MMNRENRTIEDIRLNDLFSIEELQHLQDLFSSATGVTSIITDAKGVPVTQSSNFCRLCQDIIRKTDKGRTNCYKSDAMIGSFNPSAPIISRCLSGGLWDAGASITVGGVHIANWLIGQVRNEDSNQQHFESYALEIGADSKEFMEALEDAPKMSTARFTKIAEMLFVFANELSKRAYQNIQLKKEIAERKRATFLLEQSERKYAKMLANIGDVIVVFDSKLINTDHSPNVEKWFGWHPSELVGIVIFENIHPDDLRATKDSLKEIIRGPEKPVSVECRFKCKDGSYKWVEICLVNMLHDVDINGVLGNYRDITERKEAELLLVAKNNEIEAYNEEYQQLNEELLQTNEELSKAKTKAQESNRLKTAFLQNMSHEIRTPMNAIMGFSSLIPENFEDKETLKLYSSIISQRSLDLLNIINDILDVAKIESGQLHVTLEPFIVNELLNDVHLFFVNYQKKYEKEHVLLKVEPCLLNAPIVSDRVKLKQILGNLIENAFKFTESGSITFGCQANKENRLAFYVSDTGIGIPTSKQGEVFERFLQLNQDQTKCTSGTGLGLSIVKGLVQVLGGEIELESELGKGSTFKFTIATNQAKEKMAEQSKRVPLLRNMAQKKVLIIEDDWFNGKYLEEILTGMNAEVEVTPTGKEGIDLALTQDFDLILMDIRLPDINGHLATERLMQARPQLKIIAQTAYASFEDKQKALKAGCIDFISKPIDRNSLIALLQKHVTSFW